MPASADAATFIAATCTTRRTPAILPKQTGTFFQMKHENITELKLDHPGATDPKYRARRDFIARRAGTIDYLPEENKTWQVATDYSYSEMQSKLFVIRSFDDLIAETKRWLNELVVPLYNS